MPLSILPGHQCEDLVAEYSVTFSHPWAPSDLLTTETWNYRPTFAVGLSRVIQNSWCSASLLRSTFVSTHLLRGNTNDSECGVGTGRAVSSAAQSCLMVLVSPHQRAIKCQCRAHESSQIILSLKTGVFVASTKKGISAPMVGQLSVFVLSVPSGGFRRNTQLSTRRPLLSLSHTWLLPPRTVLPIAAVCK